MRGMGSREGMGSERSARPKVDGRDLLWVEDLPGVRRIARRQTRWAEGVKGAEREGVS